jgi:hypothetical protein
LVLIIIYNISSTKLEIRAEQFLPGSEGWGVHGGCGGKGAEMTQTLYAHLNKRYIKKRKVKTTETFVIP